MIQYPNPLSVLCVDENATFTQLLCAALGSEIDMKVVAVLHSTEQLISTAKDICPDVIVIDLAITGDRLPGILKETTEHCPDSRVIVLSEDMLFAQVSRAMDAGAHGYANKNQSTPELIDAIRRVGHGEFVLPV